MEASETLKTGEQWAADPAFMGLTIFDHDGFDRHGDFEYSFRKELLTKKQFEQKLMNCTIQWSLPKL